MQPEIVSVADLADDAWGACREQAERKQVRFAVDVPHDAEFVYADPSALRQILSNLFGNSLRYLPEGGAIEVAAHSVAGPMLETGRTSGERKDTVPHGGWICVEVRDTGAGIASAHLPRIFERFYRADAARSREEGGTGLGLAIVKHMVEGHGGTVQAESLLGAGTTIRFTLPAPDEPDSVLDDAAASAIPADSPAVVE